jgi:hypothetical protein
VYTEVMIMIGQPCRSDMITIDLPTAHMIMTWV